MKTTYTSNVHACHGMLLMSLILTAPLLASDIRIDGDFQDWNDIGVVAEDPQGDALGAFDVTRVYTASQDAILYLRFDVGRVLNLQNGPDGEGTLVILLELPDQRKLRLDTRGRRAHVEGDEQERIPWSDLNYVVGPTFAQDEFEVQIDLSAFAIELGDSVSIQFEGSDQLAAPVSHTFSKPSSRPARRPFAPLPGTDVRIVSFNTYVNGLSDPNRVETAGRLLKAMEGDIYCFQEEWESNDIDKVMRRLTLLDSVGLRHIHKVRGNVIASKLPLKVLRSGNSNYAAARVDLDGRSLVVMSVHLSAMGYIGSREDLWRVEQAMVLLDAVEDVNQEGRQNAGEAKSKPGIVLIGDYNLVGSRTPVDLLVGAQDAGLSDWLLPNLVGESVTTWRGGRWSSFAPGKLDYCLYSSATLTRQNGFVLDSELLDQTVLQQLGLEATDSSVSDHLMAVVDFQFSPVLGSR